MEAIEKTTHKYLPQKWEGVICETKDLEEYVLYLLDCKKAIVEIKKDLFGEITNKPAEITAKEIMDRIEKIGLYTPPTTIRRNCIKKLNSKSIGFYLRKSLQFEGRVGYSSYTKSTTTLWRKK